MSDYISKEELKERLVYCRGLGRKSLEAVIEVINKQPQIEKCADCSRRKWYTKGYQDGLNADKWIPCEERLPSEDEEVIISTKTERVYSGVYTTRYGENKREGFICYDGFMWMNVANAWQPLPTPYKKEGAENE